MNLKYIISMVRKSKYSTFKNFEGHIFYLRSNNLKVLYNTSISSMNNSMN